MKFNLLKSANRLSLTGLTMFLLAGIACPISLFAQEEKYQKYEVKDVSPEDFTIENDIIDDNAEAVFIFELGDSHVTNNLTELMLESTRSYRIKILTEKGLSLADEMVGLYVGTTNEEKIGRVKGGVYNLENGKVEFEKLKNSDWFVEDVNERTKVARMTFKNVKVGSIIDLTYTVFSPYLKRMPDWEFQHNDIPVLYSEYYIRYPEILGYKILQFGYHPLLASAHTTETEVNSGVGVTATYKFKKVYVLACENIPAMRDEPLMNSPENYRTKVITELNYVDYPGRPREYIYKDWVGSANDFLEEASNSQYMNPKNRHDYFTLDRSDCKTLSDSIAAIYYHIRGAYTRSDERNFISPQRNPRELIATERATSSEINWMLVSTLRANSIEAFPVLVSTRSAQRILKEYPIFTQFTSCLAVVKSGDSNILLDATSAALMPGEISDYYYNGDGLLVKKDAPEWIPIVGISPSNAISSFEFNSFEDGILSGQMRLRVSGLYRTRIMEAILKGDTEDIVDILPIIDNVELTLSTEESDFQSSPMDLRFQVALTLEKFGNSYLLPTVIYRDMQNNLLKDKDRRYPVNFRDQWTDSYTCLVHLDSEKYDVTLPENANFILPMKDGVFSFLSSYNFGSLVIRNKVEINKTTFLPSEYSTLREFYDLISTTHSSFIEISEK